jgi:succinyl-CoA synthetase beta subunit
VGSLQEQFTRLTETTSILHLYLYTSKHLKHQSPPRQDLAIQLFNIATAMSPVRPLSRALRQHARPKTNLLSQRRHLSIHEYQSQSLLRDAGVPVPQGHLATTPSEALSHAKTLGGNTVVLKSQILAGGRGKGHFLNSSVSGGIQLADSPSQAEQLASGMLGHHLVTKQTKPEGIKVEKLYIAEKVPYINEYYLSITIDREAAAPALIVSRHGGMNIEDAAQTDPASVAKLRFDYLADEVDDATLHAAQKALDLPDQEVADLRELLTKLITLFKQKDATLIEINPLVRTESKQLLCLDAKFSFDNAAAPRQKELFSWEEKAAREKSEVEAEKSGLVYVRLEGDIGNVVNGAGLAMATNDAVEFYGGRSANFLDAGGQATKETMVDAFRIILDDERVRVILVNIYGGKDSYLGIQDMIGISSMLMRIANQVSFAAT